MNLKVIYILLFTTLIAIKPSPILSQTLTLGLDSAANEFRIGNYQLAFELYKRCAFFSNEKERLTWLEPLAVSAFYCGEYLESLKYFSILKKQSEIKLETSNEIMELAALLNLKLWNEVIEETDSLKEFESDTALYNNALFYRLLSFVQLNNKELAIKTAQELKKRVHFQDPIGFDSLLMAFEKDKLPSPQKAKSLSYIVPGLGQFYCKDYKNGFNALLLNGILIGGMVYTAHLYSWPNAILFWAYHVPHYYTGNTRAAKEIALEKITSKKWHYFENFKKMAR